MIEGELKTEQYKDNNFIRLVDEKRDKKYFLNEPSELVKGKWVTRSFFAFGDFKESINPKYMIALCKGLRQI